MITGLALMNEIEDRLSWRQTETLEGTLRPETRKLLRMLNRVLNSMQTLDDWPLLRETADLQLVAYEQADETDGDLTNGSNRIVLRSADFDDSYKNRVIRLNENDTLYRITRVVSQTELDLNRPWVGEDVANGAVSYKIAQDRYVLPMDFDRPTGGWTSFFGNTSIRPVGPERFLHQRRKRGSSMVVSDPDIFTVFGLDDSQTFQILHFDPYPQFNRVLYYTYQKNHPVIETDEDRILFPKTHEGIVLEAILHLANRDYTDESKVQMVLQDMLRSINVAQGAGNVSQDRISFSPSGAHRRSVWARYGTAGRRIDWGQEFDRSDRYGFFY